jgi:hypothetical protein
MTQQTATREIPDGYERVNHHDHLTLHHPDRGIIIMVSELSPFQDGWERFDWGVSGARNQKGFYDGAFQSLSHAEDKALELAQNH